MLRPSVPVGGRLFLFLTEWKTITQDKYILNIVQSGLKIWCQDHVPLITVPPLTWCFQQDRLMGQEVLQDLLNKNAIEVVQDPNTPGFYFRHFPKKKPDGSVRPISNLKPLNLHIQTKQFKMHTITSVRSALNQGNWAVSIDLKDAYFHVAVHQSARKYLRFVAGGMVYQYKSMPFGLCTAPQLFTALVKPLVKWAVSLGINLIVYLDDWLIFHEDKNILESHRDQVIEKAVKLGWIINLKKSDLTPAQQFEFLGVQFDLEQYTAKPGQKRLANFQAQMLMLSQPQITVHSLLSIQGHLVALADLVPLGALMRREFQYLLRELGVQRARGGGNMEQKFPVTPHMRQTLTWWMKPEHLMTGVRVHKDPVNIIMMTDASTHGWGAHCGDQSVRGVWTQDQQKLHINVLEMMAVKLSMIHFQSVLSNKHVLIRTDNTTVLAYLSHQGGVMSHSLTELTAEILLWSQKHAITISASHIASDLNVLADRLSRTDKPVPSEWKLHHQVFQQISKVLFKPAIDLFATRWNKQITCFVSPCPDQSAYAVNALTLDWNDFHHIYLYPPLGVMMQVMDKLQDYQGQALVIAPLNKEKLYHNRLTSLLIDWPRRLPNRPDLLSQGLDSVVLHHNPDALNLHVWPASGNLSLIRDFHTRLQNWYQSHKEIQHWPDTITSGGSLWIGSTPQKTPILSMPL